MTIRKALYVLFFSIITVLLLAGFMTGCGGGGGGDDGDGTADTTPPTVLSVQPASGAAGVSINTVVTVTFSEDMNDATITADTVTLTPSRPRRTFPGRVPSRAASPRARRTLPETA